MARLRAGEKPTPHKERLQGYRKELVDRGGRRLNADIEADAATALDIILADMARRAPSHKPPKVKDALSKALIVYAAQIKPAGRPPE